MCLKEQRFSFVTIPAELKDSLSIAWNNSRILQLHNFAQFAYLKCLQKTITEGSLLLVEFWVGTMFGC
jgi:hypothetical protein